MDSILDSTVPENTEQERLQKLYSYNVLDTYGKTGTFQHVAGMAARIFNVPIAVVNFVDEKRVVAEGSVGIEGVSEFSREISLCSLAILQDQVTVFKNAKEEPCLLSNPAVHGEFGLQFYAGAPLKTPDGYKIGTVAIADKKPREFSKMDAELLEGLGAVVMEELEERLAFISRKQTAAE